MGGPAKYSADWVKQKIGERTWLPLRDCSLCAEDIGYVIDVQDNVWFRSSCGCASGPDRPASFDEIANTLSIQTSDQFRDLIMERMLAKKRAG